MIDSGYQRVSWLSDVEVFKMKNIVGLQVLSVVSRFQKHVV